jgi:hypothetical protein
MYSWYLALSQSNKILVVQATIYGVQAILLFFSFWAVVWSNRQVAKAQRVSTLQQMVAEMNQLRQFRASNPSLEKELFEARHDWSDLQVQNNIVAVQLANILEWAYIARRENLLDKRVWESWVKTWQDVILASQPLRQLFTPTVWTFGRDPYMAQKLHELVIEHKAYDPRREKSILMRVFWC